jgi:hypothetical protein
MVTNIVYFSHDKRLLFGESGSYWAIKSKSEKIKIPNDGEIANISDREYVLDEISKKFPSLPPVVSESNVIIFDRPEGEVQVVIAHNKKLMWVWRLGR